MLFSSVHVANTIRLILFVSCHLCKSGKANHSKFVVYNESLSRSIFSTLMCSRRNIRALSWNFSALSVVR